MALLDDLSTDRDIRRFLTTFVVQSRIFRAEDYVVAAERARAMSSWDDLLSRLRAAPALPGAALSGPQERALAILPSLAGDASRGSHVPPDLLTLSVPFSWVRPAPSGELDVFQRTREILLLVTSPNYGAELFAQTLVDTLRRRFPGAPIDIATSCPLLWRRPPAPVRSVLAFERGEEIAPFVLAAEASRREGQLLIFVESERGETFRNLEAVGGLAPFVFLDTDNALARLVDPPAGLGVELQGHGKKICLASALEDVLGQLGFPPPPPPPVFVAPARGPLLVDVSRARGRWFYDIGWMAETIDAVVGGSPGAFDEILLFAPANPEEQERARQLASLLATAGVPHRSLASVTSVTEALDAAAPGAVVIGPEGLLTSLGYVVPILSVTVSARRPVLNLPPSPSSISVLGGALPGQTSRLLRRFLRLPTTFERSSATAITAAVGAVGGPGTPTRAQVESAVASAARSAAHWNEVDPELAGDFVESSADALAFVTATGSATDEAAGPAWARLIRRARVEWRTSNFGRYVSWVVQQPAAES